MFTRQHYEAIAATLAASKPAATDQAGRDAWYAIKGELERLFKWDNTRFDRVAFAEACHATVNKEQT